MSGLGGEWTAPLTLDTDRVRFASALKRQPDALNRPLAQSLWARSGAQHNAQALLDLLVDVEAQLHLDFKRHGEGKSDLSVGVQTAAGGIAALTRIGNVVPSP